MAVVQLPASTRKLISSSQVITSVSSVVKELVENAIDAQATNIEVKLENNGLNRIEVKDDGCGIRGQDIVNVCLPHHTSKISEFSDLEKLKSYGFRGEALSSLCNVAEVSITTRTAEDQYAVCYSFSRDGSITNSKPSHLGKGTQVVASNLFRNLPVRKQFLSSSHRASMELKQTLAVVKCLAIINPELRVSLCHNKCMVWQKPGAATLRESVLLGLGHGVVSRLEELMDVQNELSIIMLVPKKHSKDVSTLFQTTSDGTMIYFNHRPVLHKKLQQLLLKTITGHFKDQQICKKYPICVLSIKVEPSQLDVNLEPNKTRVLCHNEDEILARVEKILLTYYQPVEEAASVPKRPRREQCEDHLVNGTHDQNSLAPVGMHTHSSPETTSLPSEQIGALWSKGHLKTSDGELIQCNTLLLPGVPVHKDNIVEDQSRATLTEDVLRESVPQERRVSHKGLEFRETNQDSPLPLFQRESIKQNEIIQESPQVTESVCLDKIMQEISLPPHEKLDFEEVIQENLINKDENIEERLPVKNTACLDGIMNEGPKLPPEALQQHNEIIEKDTDLPVFQNDSFTFDNCLQSPNKLAHIDDNSSILPNDLCDKNVPYVEKEGKDRTEMKLVLNKKTRGKSKDVFNTSVHSVTSQMGCKEQSGFTKFSREIRPKLLADNPGVPFTKVARMLVDQWRELSEEERLRYKIMAKEERSKPPQQSVVSHKLSDLFGGSPQRVQPKTSQIELDITFHDITLRRNTRQNEESHEVALIGQLKPCGTWIYRKARELGIVRHWGLQESVIFQQLLAEHSIPVKLLDPPLFIYERTLGPDLWQVMLSLETTCDLITSCRSITSPVIVKNGFRILLKPDGAVLTHLASVIRFYGLDELREVLRLSQVSHKLAQCRPQKVVHYIKSEAVRITRQAPAAMDCEQLIELLKSRKEDFCLHQKKIFEVIHTIES
ncbi:PMS1 protein homolog 1 [Anabrus simplex]|uniref:PMS1 protein homolog 1 n=1 Tax=Anabrus simplex TaxID=316456 RepID=UPI0035A2BD6B